MKKRSVKKEKTAKRLFNRLGMTYVELICALALLSLVVVMFTPMLLSSYETLYNAGEKVESVYDSKKEMEEGLAVRSSISIANVGMTFKMNAESVFENMNVAGRRIVSTIQGNFETVFHGVRARVDLLSPDVIYDDTTEHEIILQTTGLDWEDGDVTLFNLPENRNKTLDSLKDKMEPGQILIDVIKPQKDKGSSGTSTDEQVYTLGDRTGIVQGTFDPDPAEKIISFKINGIDFTTSPVKICVYYVNERGVLKTLSDYLYIKPARIIFAGATTSDYFTSAGVEQVDVSTAGNTEKKTRYEFNIEGRGMSLTNSKLLNGLSPTATGTVINTVTWVDTDENAGLDPYYVMAGTNGSVYRMYNMNTKSDLQSVLGTKNAVDATTDLSYNIDTGETIHPSFWSGEMSDQYYFRTENNGNGYGTESDNKNDCSEDTQYNAFDKKLRYLMAYSGFRTGYSYRMQASRRISYILTEANAYSFRFGGKKAATGDFSGYTAIWEPDSERYLGPGETHTPGLFSSNKWDVDHSAFSQRIIAGDIGSPYEKPIYFSNHSQSENNHYERNIAWLGAVSYTSVNIFDLAEGSELYNKMFGGTGNDDDMGFFFANKGNDDEYSGNGGTIPNYLQNNVATTVNVTSAVYLPGSGSNGKGQVIYFGTVPAYSLVRQASDIGKPDRYMYNGENIRDSRATLYYIFDFDSNGTIIARCASSDNNNMGGTSDILKKQTRNTLWGVDKDGAGYASDVGSAGALFTKANENQTYYYIDTDLKFTFGYCSRWRMALGSVTSDGSKEATKSYESFYTNSHYNARGLNYLNYYDRVPSTGINSGSVDNMYYNVWFPGEHYTLTKTATCDEVTVAVGYTVSGSTFMEQSCVESGFYGTALGSVYNDGVLAAYTSSGNNYTLPSEKGGKTTIFQNLLYCKSKTFTDPTLHSRENIRFTAVGLNAETTRSSDTTGSKEYYAYYGDNKGNVYRSLVAKSSVTFVDGGKDEDNDVAEEKVSLVNAIPDTSVAEASSTTNGMQEIILSGGTGITWAGKGISSVFAEVVSIECYDDIIIITGNPQPAASNFFGAPSFNGFVVGIKGDDGNWTWKLHALQFSNGAFLQGSIIDSAKIIGSYLYVSGYGNINQTGANDCWVGGINLDSLRKITNGIAIPIAGYNTSSSDDVFMWQNLGSSNRIYAIDGYTTT